MVAPGRSRLCRIAWRIIIKGFLRRLSGVDPTRRSLTGTGGYVKVGRKGNAKWNFSETFTWSSPGFDLNDMGYMKETDYLMNETEIMYRQTDIWKIFRYNAFTLVPKEYVELRRYSF